MTPRAIANRIVTHVTEVRLLLPLRGALRVEQEALGPPSLPVAGIRVAEQYPRVAAMMEVLERHGFTFRAGKRSIVATSAEVEAFEAKRMLLDAGFADREFQIILEYTRGWGML
ncbi:MAG TPA: hypothetical protein VGL13_10305 [Polyangiaceae bacterium]